MSQPVEPLQQATFTLAGCTLQAVLLPNGQPAVAFMALCEALALDPDGQRKRARAHPMLTEALVSARLETAGGSQLGNVLIAWGIAPWLASIRLASVRPDIRDRLIIFQKEIVALLYGQFFRPMIAAPDAPPARISRWEALHAALAVSGSGCASERCAADIFGNAGSSVGGAGTSRCCAGAVVGGDD